MVDEADREPALRDYLLGGLAPAQREEIEERLLADPDFHAEVQATGDDLIHAYLAGDLSVADRERFETHFLSTPRRRERVAFVRTLVSAVDRVRLGASRPTGAHAVPPAPRRSISVLLPWAAALLVGLGAGGWSLNERRLREREAVQAKQTEEDLRQKLTATEARVLELKRSASSPNEGIAIWPLRDGTERGTEPAESFSVAPGGEWIRLRVPLPPGVRMTFYRASLRTANDEEILPFRALQANPAGRTVDVMVPAGLLRPGAYVLSIRSDSGGLEITAIPFFVR
jgi:hypothetical protein